MTAWRLLDTGHLPGPLNMAIDMAILHSYERGQLPPTMRFYQWSPPAVSLGYFQKDNSVDIQRCNQLGIDVVRRPTGGRAVLHLDDLTYSIVAGRKDGMPYSVSDAYRLLAKGLFEGFRKMGFEPESENETSGLSKADICFMRFARGDLLYQRKKFMGSAQTWIGASLLQHGSIILEPQIETLKKIFPSAVYSDEDLSKNLQSRITSLSEIFGRRIDQSEVKSFLMEGMSHALGVELQTGDLTTEEWEKARELSLNQAKSDPVHDQDLKEFMKLLDQQKRSGMKSHLG